MKLIEKINFEISEAAFEAQMDSILKTRNYQLSSKFIHFLVKKNFSSDLSNAKSKTYLKTWMSVLPLWHLTLFYQGDHSVTAVEFSYYTKGLEILDIFAIKNQWVTEVQSIKNSL